MSTGVQKIFGITTGNRMLARMVGFPTVCAASILSDRSVRLMQGLSKNPNALRGNKVVQVLSISPSVNEFYDLGFIHLPKRDVHVYVEIFSLCYILSWTRLTIRTISSLRCMLGLGGFKSLGGRFWAIAPSSYAAPGSFARKPITGNKNYIAGNDKAQLLKNYKRFGCHVCGSKAGSPIGDHNPPVSIGELVKKPSYQFYPHCASCSSRQGGILGAAKNSIGHSWGTWKKIGHLKAAAGGSNAYNHALQLRFHHFAGGILGMTIADPNKYLSVPESVKSSLAAVVGDIKKRFTG